MQNSPENEKERVQNRKKALRQFYAADPNEPSSEELEWSTPILDALKNTENRYKEIEPIAAGGEKRIVRTFDQRLKRCVAMAHPIKTETRDNLEQFLREAQLTANLTHPNIVPIYNMGTGTSGTPFFTMELVPGDSLKDIIQKLKKNDPAYKARYPLDALLAIFGKVCDAVAYAHSCDVLHLDIKPDNIRVGLFGEVLLCDWGLAHVGLGARTIVDPNGSGLDGEILNDMTLSGIMKGTPGFMAPEQINGDKKKPQTDIYALGAILYSILTYELPVKGNCVNEIIENTRKGNVIPPRIRRPSRRLPRSLTAVAMKALAKLPENRYANVQELQQDISYYLTGHPTQAEHAGLYTRLILLSQRHRILTFWLMTFLALLAIVMSVNLTIINHQRQLAEDNFSLYKMEHNKSSQISEELAALSYHAQGVRSYISAKNMIPVTERLLEHNDIDPDSRHAILSEKARMHFMLQQFNAAKNTLEQLPTKDLRSSAMLDLCKEYAEKKPNDFSFLSDLDLAELLSHHKAISRDLSLFLYFHYTRQNPKNKPEEYVKLASVMLFWLNELKLDTIPELKLSKRPEGWHLDLSHTPYSTYLVTIPLVYRQNILMRLKLYSLDISYTPISLTRELKNIDIKELRMVGVKLEPQTSMPRILKSIGLERVIIGEGQYPEALIRKIKKQGIEVIEEKENID